MYRFTWTYNTPSITEYHGKEYDICFHTTSVAVDFFRTRKNDTRYVNLKVFQHQYEWIDVTDAWST